MPLLLLLLLIPLAWAGGFWAGAPAVHRAGPALTTFLRFAIASAALFPVLLATRRSRWIAPGRALARYTAMAVVVGGLCYHFTFYAGLAHVHPVRGSVILAMTPLLNAALESGWLGRRLGRRFWLGLAVALCGVLLALSVGWDRSSLLSAWTRWDSLLALAGVCWSAYCVLSQRLRQPEWDGAWMGAWFALGTTAASSVFAGERLASLAGFTLRDWLPHVYLGLVSTATAYTLHAVAITRIGAARTALYSFLVPILAALLRPALEDRAVEGLELAGSLLVFGGLCLALAGPRTLSRLRPGAKPGGAKNNQIT